MRPFLIFPLLATEIVAGSPVQWIIGLNGAFAQFSKNSKSNDIFSSGIWADVENRYGGLRLGLGKDSISSKNGYASGQLTQFGSGRLYFPAGNGNGKIVVQADIMKMGYGFKKFSEGYTRAVGLHVGYFSPQRQDMFSYHIEGSIAKSTYDFGLEVTQLKPTFGFGFNDNRDWVSLEGEHIMLKNKNYKNWKRNTNTFSISWSHYFLPGNLLKPDRITLMGQGGDRFYAVDTKHGVLFNHSDAQPNKYCIDAGWNLRSGLNFSFGIGRSSYKKSHRGSVDTYSSVYYTSGLTFKF